MRLCGLVASLIVLQQTDCFLKELYAPSGDDNPIQNQQVDFILFPIDQGCEF